MAELTMEILTLLADNWSDVYADPSNANSNITPTAWAGIKKRSSPFSGTPVYPCIVVKDSPWEGGSRPISLGTDPVTESRETVHLIFADKSTKATNTGLGNAKKTVYHNREQAFRILKKNTTGITGYHIYPSKPKGHRSQSGSSHPVIKSIVVVECIRYVD